MLAGVYAQSMWGHTDKQAAVHISAWMNTVYFHTRHTESELPFLLSKLYPLGKNIGKSTEIMDFRSGLMLDKTKLMTVTKDIDITTKLADGRELPIYNNLKLSDISKSITGAESFPDVKDLRAISSGIYSVGTAGNYSDLGAWELDLTTLDGTMTANVISDTTETARILISGDNWGTYICNIKPNVAHGGDPTAGFTISIAQTLQGIYYQPGNSAYTGNIYGLTWKRTTAAANRIIQINTGVAGTVNLYDTFVDGNSNTSDGVRLDNAGANTAYNVAIRNCAGVGMHTNLANDVLKQLLVHGCTTGYDLDGQATQVINCAGGNTTDAINTGSATITDCISGDGSLGATKTIADEFYLEDTQSNYAQPKIAGTPTTTNPGQNLMDGAWTDEIGPKVREAGASGNPWYQRLQQIHAQ